MTDKPRVLHLAYEDHLAPGSGGGSVRTREINERLSARFDIDQVFFRYPGARRRSDHSLNYAHLGSKRGGRFVRQLSYFVRLPTYTRGCADSYDLVVEDFGAPFGSVAIPRFTRTPTIAVVQWLFASDKSRQYHLPFTPIESLGLRSHSTFIAVSSGIAEQIRLRTTSAQIHVVANGLPGDLLDRAPATGGDRRDVLYLGRLDIQHKGLDLLLASFEQIKDRIDHDLLIAGDGDGATWLRREVTRRGLTHRVRMLGRVPESDRFRLLESASVVAMPSRYESFGMVAAEAAAVGTPVVAYDIPCLRDLVPVGSRVEPYSPELFAAKLVDLCSNELRRHAAAERGRQLVMGLSWDTLARDQGDIYEAAMSSIPVR